MKEAGWEIELPKFLLNPVIWIAAAGIIIFGIYKLIRGG